MTFTQEVEIKVDGVWKGMHFYEREHSRMCLLVWEWVYGHAMCVFSSLPLPPATLLSPPMLAARSGRFYLQCDGVEIAGWGIITRAIKERFTGWPVSGVSTVPTLQHCTVLGHQRKAQNGESEASGGTWWLKHEGEGRGSSSGICFMVGESEAEEENLILMSD